MCAVVVDVVALVVAVAVIEVEYRRETFELSLKLINVCINCFLIVVHDCILIPGV